MFSSNHNPTALLLLVDDVPANLKVLASSLQDQFRLKLATSGALALDLARRDDKPDLILLDLHMPEMGGTEVLQRLRADPVTRDIPVIFATADHSVEVESVGLGLGADDFVTKPINIAVLMARINNILRRKNAEHALQRSEGHLRTLFETMNLGVVYHDAQGAITQANPAAERILGVSSKQMVGRTPQDPMWRVVDGNEQPLPADELPVVAVLQSRKPVFDMLMGVFNPQRQGYSWIQASAVPRFDFESPRLTGVFATFTDITDRRNLEKQLERQAAIDPLTGIRNRRSFFEQAEREFTRARRQDASVAMLMLDLDHFKHINDTNGHAVGDEVLKHFTQLVVTRMRESDLLGRVGGEEFAMLLPDTSFEGALSFANQLLDVLRKSPAGVDDGPIVYTASIGLVMTRARDTTPDALLSRADQALYRAKHEGRDRVVAVHDEQPMDLLQPP